MSHEANFRTLIPCLCVAVFAFHAIPQAKAGTQPDTARSSDWEKRMVIAQAKQEEGRKKMAEAGKLFGIEKTACFEKFRVTDCQEEARQRYLISANAARRLENEGLAEERKVRQEQLDDKDARYRAEEPQRAADRAERKARIAEERKKGEEKRARKLANRQKKAEQGAQRRARDAERLEKKKARHEEKVAGKMEKARQQPAATGSTPAQ